MKNIYRTSRLGLILMLLSMSRFAEAQCLTGPSLGSIGPLITWQTVGVAAGSPAYYSFTGQSAVTYTFTYCQGGGTFGGDPYLTVSNNVPVSQAFNDDFCGLGSQVIWTCPSSGIYRLYLSGCCPCSNAPSATLAYRGSSNPFPPAVNDDCPNAIGLAIPDLAVGTCTNAYTETVGVVSCASNTLDQPGVWYSVVGNGNKLGVDLCSTVWDSKIFVFSGMCGALNCVTSNNDNGPLCNGTAASATWCSVPSTTYYILVMGASAPSGFSLAVTQTLVGAAPSVTVSAASPSFCPSFQATFIASGANIYQWSTGANTATMVTTPTAITVYTVTGWSAATCGQDTKTVSFEYYPVPSVSASISQPSVCTGNTVATVGSGAAIYQWSHGQPNGSPFFPSATTVYTVIGASAVGCTASAMVGVTVVVTPILAPIATPTVICLGSSGTIAAQGASNYTWLPIGTFPGSNQGTIVITPTLTATYTLTKANSNCVDVKTITVYVNQLPNVIAITSHTVVCAGSQATLSGGGANTYTWIPSTFNMTGATVAVTPTATTIYTVTGSDGTCTAVYTIQVATNPVPTLQATASNPTLCAGGSTTLSATGAVNYTWTPGPLIGGTVVATPPIPTAYVLVGMNSFSCTSTIQQPVIVYPNPTVNAIPNRTLVCIGGPSTITATGAHTYSWSTGPLTTTILVNPQATTVYTVTGTYTNSGCSASKTVMVQAYTPVTAINGPTAVCIGSSITISSAPANSYTWSLNGNFLSSQQNLLISPTVNTTYMLGTTSTSNNVSCVGANSVTIQVNALPLITASCNRTLICKAWESTELIAAGGISYNWLFLGAGSNMIVSPIVQTVYTVQGTDANGCVNTATILIRVSACVGVGELSNSTSIKVYPNPSNGEFTISSSEDQQLQIINELGQVVAKVELNSGNNHFVKVKGLAKGIYLLQSGQQIHSKLIVE